MQNTLIHLDQDCFPTPNPDFQPKYIILHDIKFDINQTEKLFRDRKLSSHYYVSSNGQVYEFARNKAAYHAGRDSAFKNDKNLNNNSIGIETESDWSYQMPEAQYESLVTLLKDLISDYTISTNNILSHAEISPYRFDTNGRITYGKSDPGINFPWKRLSQQGIGAYHYIEINPLPKVIFSFGHSDRYNRTLLQHSHGPDMMVGDLGVEYRRVLDIHEVPSTKPLQQISAIRAFQKKSNNSPGIKEIQACLRSFGYVLTPLNGLYDMQMAAVLNAFYLRYYPEWFIINQESIRSAISKELEVANMINVKGWIQDPYAISLKDLAYGDINDLWIFEHNYHLCASNIDENAIQIMRHVISGF